MFPELMVMSYRWSTNYQTKKMGVELSNALKWDDLLYSQIDLQDA